MGMMEKLNELTASGAREYLTFRLDQEEYGIDILKVQEIRGYDQVTRIANTPTFIKGVTNLRGVIVPIIDLRVKFAQSGVPSSLEGNKSYFGTPVDDALQKRKELVWVKRIPELFVILV